MGPSGAGFDLDGVTVRYGDLPAVREVTLSIRPGEAVAFVGPSGAGKTTLLNVMCGSIRPDRGRVQFDGEDLSTLSRAALRRARSQIGFVHQDLRLVPNLRVAQNVISGRFGRMSLASAARAMILPPREALREVHAILDRVGIAEKMFERTDRLSGGQLQRVAIARALFQRPRALLADEPVASIDPARARDTVELLVRLAGDRGLTLVCCLHHLELARRLFPRLVGMRHGRIRFDREAGSVGDREFHALYDLDTDDAPP